MLIMINHSNREKSIYECDRCKKRFETDKKRTIYVQKGLIMKRNKLYDLCIECFKKLRKGVEFYDKK